MPMVSFRVSDEELARMKWAAEFLEKNSLSEYLKERSLKDTDRPMVKVKVKDHTGEWRLSV